MNRTRIDPRLRIALLLVVAVGALHPAQADAAKMEHGAGQKKLERFLGTWNTRQVMKIDGEQHTFERSETFAWVEPTRVWMKKEVVWENQPGLGTMTGIELWAYDAKQDEYTRYWFDNQSPDTFPNRGRWLDENTLEMKGSIEWEGQTIQLKNIYRFSGEDRFSWVHYQSWDDEDSFKEKMRIDYAR